MVWLFHDFLLFFNLKSPEDMFLFVLVLLQAFSIELCTAQLVSFSARSCLLSFRQRLALLFCFRTFACDNLCCLFDFLSLYVVCLFFIVDG